MTITTAAGAGTSSQVNGMRGGGDKGNSIWMQQQQHHHPILSTQQSQISSNLHGNSNNNHQVHIDTGNSQAGNTLNGDAFMTAYEQPITGQAFGSTAQNGFRQINGLNFPQSPQARRQINNASELPVSFATTISVTDNFQRVNASEQKRSPKPIDFVYPSISYPLQKTQKVQSAGSGQIGQPQSIVAVGGPIPQPISLNILNNLSSRSPSNMMALSNNQHTSQRGVGGGAECIAPPLSFKTMNQPPSTLSEYQKYTQMLPSQATLNNAISFLQSRQAAQVLKQHAATADNNFSASNLFSRGDISSSDVSGIFGGNSKQSFAPIENRVNTFNSISPMSNAITNGSVQMNFRPNALIDLKQQMKAQHNLMTRTQERLLFNNNTSTQTQQQQNQTSMPQQYQQVEQFSLNENAPQTLGGLKSLPLLPSATAEAPTGNNGTHTTLHPFQNQLAPSIFQPKLVPSQKIQSDSQQTRNPLSYQQKQFSSNTLDYPSISSQRAFNSQSNPYTASSQESTNSKFPQQLLHQQTNANSNSDSPINRMQQQLLQQHQTPHTYKRNHLQINTHFNTYLHPPGYNVSAPPGAQSISGGYITSTQAGLGIQSEESLFFTPQSQNSGRGSNNAAQPKELPMLTDYLTNKSKGVNPTKHLMQQLQIQQQQVNEQQKLVQMQQQQIQSLIQMQLQNEHQPSRQLSTFVSGGQRFKNQSYHPNQHLQTAMMLQERQQLQQHQNQQSPISLQRNSPKVGSELQCPETGRNNIDTYEGRTGEKKDSDSSILINLQHQVSSGQHQVDLLQEILHIVTEQQRQQQEFFKKQMHITKEPPLPIAHNPSTFLPPVTSNGSTPTVIESKKIKFAVAAGSGENKEKKVGSSSIQDALVQKENILHSQEDEMPKIKKQSIAENEDDFAEAQMFDQVFVNSGKISERDTTPPSAVQGQDQILVKIPNVITRQFEESNDRQSNNNNQKSSPPQKLTISPELRKSLQAALRDYPSTGSLLDALAAAQQNIIGDKRPSVNVHQGLQNESLLPNSTILSHNHLRSPSNAAKNFADAKNHFSTKTLQDLIELPIVHELMSQTTKMDQTEGSGTNTPPEQHRNNLQTPQASKVESVKVKEMNSQDELEFLKGKHRPPVNDQPEVEEIKVKVIEDVQVLEKDQELESKFFNLPYMTKLNASTRKSSNGQQDLSQTKLAPPPQVPSNASGNNNVPSGFYSNALLQSKASAINQKQQQLDPREAGGTAAPTNKMLPRKIESEQVMTYTELFNSYQNGKLAVTGKQNSDLPNEVKSSARQLETPAQASHRSGVTKQSPMTFDPHNQSRQQSSSNLGIGGGGNGGAPAMKEFPNIFLEDSESGKYQGTFTMNVQKLLERDTSGNFSLEKEENLSVVMKPSRKTSSNSAKQVGTTISPSGQQPISGIAFGRKSTVMILKNTVGADHNNLGEDIKQMQPQGTLSSKNLHNLGALAVNRQATTMTPLPLSNINRQTTSATALMGGGVSAHQGALPPLPASSVPKAPPHRGKNSSSKLIFAQNVLSNFKKKEEKKMDLIQNMPVPEEFREEDEVVASTNRIPDHTSVVDGKTDPSVYNSIIVNEELIELEKKLPKPPKGKMRFIDYLIAKKDSSAVNSPTLQQKDGQASQRSYRSNGAGPTSTLGKPTTTSRSKFKKNKD